MTLLFTGAFALGVLIRELVESDGLIDQSIEGESAAGHSTSLLNFILETTEEHETFCIVVEIKRRSIGLQLLRIRSSRTSLPNAEELIFRLSLESAVTVDVGELLFEEVIIVTKRMRRIDGNFVRPGERFILEARNDKEDASFVGTIGVGADREDERALNHEILEFRDLARERFRRRHLGVAEKVGIRSRTRGRDCRKLGLLYRRFLRHFRVHWSGAPAILECVKALIYAHESGEDVVEKGCLRIRIVVWGRSGFDGRFGQSSSGGSGSSSSRSGSSFSSARLGSRTRGRHEGRCDEKVETRGLSSFSF